MIGVGLYGLKRQGDKRDGQLPVHHHSCGISHSHKDHHHHHLCGGSSKDSSLALGVGVIHGLTHVVWVLPARGRAVSESARRVDAAAGSLARRVDAARMMCRRRSRIVRASRRRRADDASTPRPDRPRAASMP